MEERISLAILIQDSRFDGTFKPFMPVTLKSASKVHNSPTKAIFKKYFKKNVNQIMINIPLESVIYSSAISYLAFRYCCFHVK